MKATSETQEGKGDALPPPVADGPPAKVLMGVNIHGNVTIKLAERAWYKIYCRHPFCLLPLQNRPHKRCNKWVFKLPGLPD